MVLMSHAGDAAPASPRRVRWPVGASVKSSWHLVFHDHDDSKSSLLCEGVTVVSIEIAAGMLPPLGRLQSCAHFAAITSEGTPRPPRRSDRTGMPKDTWCRYPSHVGL